MERDPILALTGRYIDEIVSGNGELVSARDAASTTILELSRTSYFHHRVLLTSTGEKQVVIWEFGGNEVALFIPGFGPDAGQTSPAAR